MSQTITDFNIYKIKQEILNKFRFGFNDLDNESRVTETTTNFDGNNSQTKFVLSPTNMAYVKSVTVGGVTQKYGDDWDIIWRGNDKGQVEIFVAPPTGTENIAIVWGNALTSNFVYGDFPRSDLGIHSYPRVGFRTTVRRSTAGLSGKEHIISNDILLQIKVIDLDVFNIDYIVSEIDSWILKNAKNWYYFNFITAENIAEYDNFSDNTEISNYKIIEYIIPRKLQKVSYEQML